LGESDNQLLQILIDIVYIIRNSEDIPAVVDDVLKKKDGIKVFWMQLGIYNEDAERKAKENGIDVIYNSHFQK
jgi:predicted CoA-binding protein